MCKHVAAAPDDDLVARSIALQRLVHALIAITFCVQGWLGGSSGTTLDALLVTASSQVGSTSWFAKLCNLRYLINILNVF